MEKADITIKNGGDMYHLIRQIETERKDSISKELNNISAAGRKASNQPRVLMGRKMNMKHQPMSELSIDRDGCGKRRNFSINHREVRNRSVT